LKSAAREHLLSLYFLAWEVLQAGLFLMALRGVASVGCQFKSKLGAHLEAVCRISS
jgi:hypothetical protein